MSKSITMCTSCTNRTGCICDERLAEIEAVSRLQVAAEETESYARQLEYEQNLIASEKALLEEEFHGGYEYVSNGHHYYQRSNRNGQENDPICLD